MKLWNLAWETMGNHKMWNDWKRLIIERNGWKFGTRGPRNSICMIRFGSGLFSSLWGHSMHYAKFLVFRFQKVTAPTVFIQLTKLCGKHANHGWIQDIMLFFVLYLWHFKMFVNTGPYGAGNFKTLLLGFSSDVGQTVWGHWLPWGNTYCYFSSQSAKFWTFCDHFLWHFDILTRESMEYHKRWNIWEAVCRRAKRMKINLRLTVLWNPYLGYSSGQVI